MRVRSIEEVVILSALLGMYLIQIRQTDPRNEKRERILFFLFIYKKRVAQVRLAEFTRLAVSQVQKLTEEMVEKGLMTREPGATAGGMWISLTTNGRRHMSKLLQDRGRVLSNNLKHSAVQLKSPKSAQNTITTVSDLNTSLVKMLQNVD